MTRKFIEDVFARIPKEVETEMFAVSSWDEGYCEIYVNCGRRDRSRTSVGTWELVAFEDDDDEKTSKIADDFDDIIAEAVRFANKKTKKTKKTQIN